MRTVKEVSKLTGVSIRTLHYYDRIQLLHPTMVTAAGYRLYDDEALERLQQIMLFRELEFPLKEIKQILGSPDFDRSKALEQQIQLLRLKKEHLEHLIDFARKIYETGVRTMDFQAFDTSRLSEYAKQAKETWGNTEAYKEYEEKAAHMSGEEQTKIGQDMMELFAEFGRLAGTEASGELAQQQVKKLQDFITEHYYTCTKEILSGLGEMYAAGGDFTDNIDRAGGAGTAEFAAQAIRIFCGNK